MEAEMLESLFSGQEQLQEDELIKRLEQVEVLFLDRYEMDKMEDMLLKLPREALCGSAELCYRMALMQKMKGDLQEAHQWLGTLTALRESVREGTPGRLLLENRISCASLSMQDGANTNLLLSFAVLANEFGDAKIPLAKLSATGGFPSVLRGSKDLSDLGKHYRASASIVRPLLPAFLMDNGNGACETAIAEILYEQNDLNGASLQAAAAITADNPEIAFAALSVLARIGAVDTTAKQPSEILAHIGVVLEKNRARWLEENYAALCARFDILDGDTEKIRGWIEGCNLNDLDRCNPRNSYVMLTKAKAYIAIGEYRNAVTLLENLAISAQKSRRPLDAAECLINEAIACELLDSGDLAIKKMEQSLLVAQEYGYVRVFADCGKRLFHLIARYVKETRTNEAISGQYIGKITEAAKIFSALHPALYGFGGGKESGGEKPGENPELTQSELQILQLLEEGKTNKAIAGELHVEPTTVRFHISNIFQKLGASNRTEAVKNARNMGILA